MSAADVDRDGNLDLIAANFGTPRDLRILYGQGDGTFNLPAAPVDPDLELAVDVSTGDLNADGLPDFLVNSNIYDPNAALLGQGNRSFSEPIEFNAGRATFDSTLADFNGDGSLDLATTLRNIGQVGVYANTALLEEGVFRLNGSFVNEDDQPVAFVTYGDEYVREVMQSEPVAYFRLGEANGIPTDSLGNAINVVADNTAPGLAFDEVIQLQSPGAPTGNSDAAIEFSVDAARRGGQIRFDLDDSVGGSIFDSTGVATVSFWMLERR